MLSSPDEGGPADSLHKLRHAVGVRYDQDSQPVTAPGSFADGLMCIKCNSFWLGIAVAIAYRLSPDLTVAALTPLSLSGAALLIEKI